MLLHRVRLKQERRKTDKQFDMLMWGAWTANYYNWNRGKNDASKKPQDFFPALAETETPEQPLSEEERREIEARIEKQKARFETRQKKKKAEKEKVK
jgi:hypothetical protein